MEALTQLYLAKKIIQDICNLYLKNNKLIDMQFLKKTWAKLHYSVS